MQSEQTEQTEQPQYPRSIMQKIETLRAKWTIKKPTQIEQTEYLKQYQQKVETFYKLSTESHEHNTFTEDHMSTLTNTGFYILGNALRRITSTFDDESTLVEVGAGTGFGAEYMMAGLFGEKYPNSYITIDVGESDKKAKISKYIYTDPFNVLVGVPPQYKEKIPVQWSKADIFSVINKIQNDQTIKNAILLVVCPPPIHDDRRCHDGEDISESIVSTDVIALVESVKCSKIKHVMIVRYDDHGREDLDGTSNFHSYHIPLLRRFNKWYMHDLIPIETHHNGYDYYSRCLHWFSPPS